MTARGMTAVEVAGTVSRREPRTRTGETALFALAATLASFAMQRSQALAVWRDGAFFDTDDAMHMVQVRALLAGQGWFDMLVPRLDPPSGTVMHWSRLADLPTTALVRLFGIATEPATAERLACLAYPLLLTLALFAGIARLARLLLGPEAAVPAIAGVLLSGTGIMQFAPGRIDHHAPQVLILILALTAVLESLDAARARRAATAGLLTGLSLAINLEDMPFLGILAAALVALWAWRGEAMRRPLGWFAASLGLGLPLAYAAITAPTRYGEAVCDAYGTAHLGAGMIGALGFAALTARRLDNRLHRAAAVCLLGAAALLFTVLAAPACLGNPFGAVDPLVRQLWLAEVAESLPLATLLRRDPVGAIASALPITLGLTGCLAAAVSRRCDCPGLRRSRFAIVAAIIGTGLALSLWQVRVLSSIGAIAILGGVYAVAATREFWQGRGRPVLASLSLALLFPFTAVAATLAASAFATPKPAPTISTTSTGDHAEPADDCLAPAAFAPLAGWRGTVDAPVDAGSFLLVHTALDPYAAAFHRDNDGNRFHFDLATADPARAERVARSRPLDYVMICGGLPETEQLARRFPASLAAALLSGRVPSWLEPVPIAGTPIAVFRLRPLTAR